MSWRASDFLVRMARLRFRIGVAPLRVTDHAKRVRRQSSPPPGLKLPKDYKWSWWWDTRRGCALLMCTFGPASLILLAVAGATDGWIETASGLLGGCAAFVTMGALLGFLWPTERGEWYWD